MISSVEGGTTDIAAGPTLQISHLFKRYADRVALAIAIVSVVAIAIIH